MEGQQAVTMRGVKIAMRGRVVDGRGWEGWTHDAFGFSLALLEGMLVLELGSHGDGW